MNANLVVCILVMIAHVLIASTRKEATAVSANLATKVMDGHANYLVIILTIIIIMLILLLMVEYYYSSYLEISFILDDSTCDTICDHYCDHQGAKSRCVCDRGHYLASDGITCIGKKIRIYILVRL